MHEAMIYENEGTAILHEQDGIGIFLYKKVICISHHKIQ